MPDDPDTPIADAPCEPGQEAPPAWGAESRDVRLARLHRTARALPPLPGVYLMKDHKGVVLYVGKAGRLCDRVSSYFVPSADLGAKKQPMLDLLHDFDTVVCDSEWEALLAESRLIKDIRPRFNAMQMDDKTFPYLAITMRQDYPGVYITREPASPEFKGAKIFGPFTSPGALREAAQLLQRVFKFRTCHLNIVQGDPKNQRFRPCLLHAINQCTAPCAERITRAEYRADIDRFVRFVGSRRAAMLREMRGEMERAAAELNFERAATLRDQIRALEKLDERSDRAAGWQPETEIGYINPASALRSLQKTLGLDEPIRCIEGIDIAHLRGGETVGSKVCFVDGRPFKNEYRRYRITSVEDRGAGRNDDYASIREVVSRRYRDAGQGDELYPDVILIDGGLGQLHAAQSAFEQLDVRPPMVISLAKKQELLYVQERTEPIRLGRENLGLRLCQQIRDEAHRFAQHYHHILRRKKTLGED
ncbi:MAG: excinuclease ABC subunit UvrC [Planctomycetes bacterium]|nr:excinuclease ABC subunit UvrC [Planctomycetota bacterium]